jgi:DNA-binding response OmpR family regulator
MEKANILIVEDEVIVALEIKQLLLKWGHHVTDIVTNYDEAIASIETVKPDLILLDIHLDNSQSGIELATYIGINKLNIPFMYLTSITDETTIEEASHTKPIAYLTKPFSRADLQCNILLSLYKLESGQTVLPPKEDLSEGYFYDLSNDNLYYHDFAIKLSPNEKKLLKLLIQNRGNIVPYSVIEEHIWLGELVSDSALRTLIYRLRAKLEYKIIETIPSFGCTIH